MVSYSNNPKLKYKKVELANGELEYIKNCRKIGEVYIREEDCVNVGGRWYAKNDPSLLTDYETGALFSETARGRRVYGVVDVDETHKPVYGYFTPNLAKNVKYVDNVQHSLVVALNEDCLKKSDRFIENVSEGVWYSYEEMTPDIIKKCRKIVNYYDWTVKKYNVEENVQEFAHKTTVYGAYPHPISQAHEIFGKFLNFTYGVEFEVQHGFIPEYMQYRHGIIICRDGSINSGMEAVTIPLSGAKGLCSLHHLCAHTKDRVNLDINCSMHLHLGGYPLDKKHILALWLLCTKIQDDIFDMLPPYKRHWEGFKKKNYCKELDTLGITLPVTLTTETFEKFVDNSYGRIFNFLADFKMEFSRFEEGMRHPSGHKWDIENRKTWANFINMFFSPRKTIEFRAHQATLNPVKVVNWLFICNAILRYAQVNMNEILTQTKRIRLKDVLDVYVLQHPNDSNAAFLSQYLNEYVSSRKEAFNKALNCKDFPCNWDLKDDASYDFLVSERNLLV